MYLHSQKNKDDFIKEVAQIDQEFIEINSRLTTVKRKCLDFNIIEEAFFKFRKATIE